jgi:hypothetical protein
VTNAKTEAEWMGEDLPISEPEGVLWRGRQWCVTDYGLETRGRPYLYSLSVAQLGGIRQTKRGEVLDVAVHLMEKTWLDVDDFLTALLVALSLHGVTTSAELVRRSLKDAVLDRRYLFGLRPGALPASERPKDGVYSLADLDKYQPERPWHGTTMLGEALGGAPLESEEEELEEGDDDAGY